MPLLCIWKREWQLYLPCRKVSPSTVYFQEVHCQTAGILLKYPERYRHLIQNEPFRPGRRSIWSFEKWLWVPEISTSRKTKVNRRLFCFVLDITSTSSIPRFRTTDCKATCFLLKRINNQKSPKGLLKYVKNAKISTIVGKSTCFQPKARKPLFLIERISYFETLPFSSNCTLLY